MNEDRIADTAKELQGSIKEIPMTRYWITGAVVSALLGSVAMADTVTADPSATLPQPTTSTNGPAGTVSVTKTQHVIDGAGGKSDETKSFKKHQEYIGGNGVLSAHTTLETSGEKTVVPAPAPVTTTNSTTSTTTTGR